MHAFVLLLWHSTLTIVFPHVEAPSTLAPSTNASGAATNDLLCTHNGQLLQGPYVLVMVATGQHQKSNKLPAMWLISAYRSLSRPFRKNVRYILLVRPTGGLKALVACIRPFVSAKAARKVRKVSCGAVYPWKHASEIQFIKEAVGQMMGTNILPCLSLLCCSVSVCACLLAILCLSLQHSKVSRAADELPWMSIV